MGKHFDEELKDLNNDILRMGVFAEEAIYKSVESLKNRDKNMAQEVINNDMVIDKLELIVDEKCLDLIARHQPMARDLRFITTGMHSWTADRFLFYVPITPFKRWKFLQGDTKSCSAMRIRRFRLAWLFQR